jgi:hypothetical protein
MVPKSIPRLKSQLEDQKVFYLGILRLLRLKEPGNGFKNALNILLFSKSISGLHQCIGINSRWKSSSLDLCDD